MKHQTVLSFLLAAALCVPGVGRSEEKKIDFQGAVPQPIGETDESPAQLRIRFPDSIILKGLKNPLTVKCNPEVSGYVSWANNDTEWTYNFKNKNSENTNAPVLPGGTLCSIQQNENLTTRAGTTWAKGLIQYSVTIKGPRVNGVYVSHGFQSLLREKNPLFLISFDGPVDSSSILGKKDTYLAYTSDNAPSEKIPLIAVPKEQQEALFNELVRYNYLDLTFTDKKWVLATIRPQLIPGASMALHIQNAVSAVNPSVKVSDEYTREFEVRSQFQAEVKCSNPSATEGVCLPQSPIDVNFNGRVKWNDLKATYIEYVPYKSTDRKTVRTYAQLPASQELDLWDTILDYLSNYFPFLAKYNDVVADSISFDVNIEPETQATVVLPKNLVDIDGRRFANALTTFHIKVGSMTEWIRTPNTISIFEKSLKNLSLPVGVVNLNQKLVFRKSGTTTDQWEAIQDPKKMVQLVRAYHSRGQYRSTAPYQSPMDELQVPNQVTEHTMNGIKNRPEVLQFPFAAAGATPQSGLYALEVSSPTLDAAMSNSESEYYYNPNFVLAQVTDLAVHMKKGNSKTLLWVTHLSSAAVVPNANLTILNCLGDAVETLTTNAQGLAEIEHREWASDCQAPEHSYSRYAEKDQFFVVAESEKDRTLSHSSWTSDDGYALAAPGIEWFYSGIRENEPHFHSIIGVNLVKPGQVVPVQIVAKIPKLVGFGEVKESELPTIARVNSSSDSDIFYEFPLSWKNGMAEFEWHVPGDSSVKLGTYWISLQNPTKPNQSYTATGDIEVGEFKIPLLTGVISLPTEPWIQPQDLLVGSTVRYANGVGVQKLATEFAYYFEPTSFESRTLPLYNFGSGPVPTTESGTKANNAQLPNRERPAILTDLETDSQGHIGMDLGKQEALQSGTIAEALKKVNQPQTMVVRVRYQDQGGEFQTLSRSKDIFNSAQYVGTHLITGARSEARLLAAMVDPNDRIVTDLKELDFKVQRVETRVIGEELFGGLIKNTLERTLKPVRWTNDCRLENQVVQCSIGALKAGNYAFEVTTKTLRQSAHLYFKVDSEGRVYGKRDYYHFGDEESSKLMPLALNKASYKSGEKAVVSFPAPFKTCNALVTIERSDVIESSVRADACHKGFVEVAVKAELAPNAFVSVYAITGRADEAPVRFGDADLAKPTYRIGFANLKVDWAQFKTQVKVTLNQDSFKPGDSIDATATVTPETGTLSTGSVTFVAIEEKILELRPNETYNLLNNLMQMRPHDVQTVTSLEKVEAPAIGVDEKAAEARKGGDEGGDGSDSRADFKRKLFNALVAFKANVPVVDGMARFSFKANDSLTKFKVFAIAMDAQQKFGMGETSYLSSQETQSYSNIPSVSYTGDQYPLKIIVQNNSSKESEYKVQVRVTVRDAQGNIIDQKVLSQNARIAATGSQAVDVGSMEIPDQAGRIHYDIQIYDENGKLVDAMEPDDQMIYPSVPVALRMAFIQQMDKDSETKTIEKPEGALKNQGEIRLVASNSLVESAYKQIQDRIQQDRFADLLIEFKLYKALLKGSASQSEEVQKILELLLGSIDNNGLVKYFPAARRGDVFLTARILNVLQERPWALSLMPSALKQKLTVAVEKVLDKTLEPIYLGSNGLVWMQAQTQMARAGLGLNNPALKQKAQTLLTGVLEALQANPSAYGKTVDQWSNEELLQVWLLEVALKPAEAIKSNLLSRLQGPARLVSVGNASLLNGSPSYYSYYSDETLETAELLKGLATVQAPKELVRSVATGLVNANTKGWYNTTTMTHVALALESFAHQYESDSVTGTTHLRFVEAQVENKVDWSQKKIAGINTPWLTTEETIQLTHQGQGKPWISVQGYAAVPLVGSKEQGLSVQKTIRNLNRETGFQRGDIIEVELEIQSLASIRHIALQDPIPAGSNIIGEASGSFSSGEKRYSGYWLYFEDLGRGTSTIKYQYQLNNPGSFKMAPTRAEGVYMPSVYAEIANPTMTVQ